MNFHRANCDCIFCFSKGSFVLFAFPTGFYNLFLSFHSIIFDLFLGYLFKETPNEWYSYVYILMIVICFFVIAMFFWRIFYFFPPTEVLFVPSSIQFILTSYAWFYKFCHRFCFPIRTYELFRWTKFI